MTIEAIAKIRADVSGGESVKNIRQELKAAKEEAQKLAREFGDFSPQATAAASRVAQLKDEMEDFNDRVKALNPDKFGAIANVASNIAKGFAGAEGAMALFGAESEDVQKSLLKIQGAMAFADGLQSLGALKQQFGQVAGVIKSQVITAFTSLGGAARALGAATGIGLIITAISYLVTHFKELKNAVTGMIDKFPLLGKVISAVTDTVKTIISWFTDLTDAIGLTNSALDAQVEAWEKADKAAENHIEILKASGASQEVIYFAEKKQLQERIKSLEAQKGKEEELAAARQQLQVLYAANAKRVRDEEAKDEEAKASAQKARHDKYVQQLKEKQAAEKAAKEAAEKLEADRIAKELLSKQQYADFIKESEENELNQKIERDKIEGEATAKAVAANDKVLQDHADRQLKIDAIEIASKKEIFNSAQSIATSLTDLVGRQTKLGKGIALAQIAADSARALSAALANSQAPTQDNIATGGLAGIAKYVALAANIFGNIARAKQILNGGGGGSMSGASGGTSSPQPFGFNVTQLRQPGQAQNFGDSRVYVLESDITKTQGRVKTNRQVSVF